MIIFVNILLDNHIVTSETFTATLLMAIGSTMLSVPVVAPKLARLVAIVYKSAEVTEHSRPSQTNPAILTDGAT